MSITKKKVRYYITWAIEMNDPIFKIFITDDILAILEDVYYKD